MVRFSALFVFVAVAGHAWAATSYTSLLDLQNNIPSGHHTVSEDFEALPVHAPLQDNAATAGINVDSDRPDGTVFVTDLYAAISGTQYLGLNNNDRAFKAGDRVTFTFSPPVTGFGLYVVTEESLQAGDFSLSGVTFNASNGDTADVLLSDGGGYFIGLLLEPGDRGVTTAELTAGDDFDFNYNLDDLLVVREGNVSSGSSSSSSSSSDRSSGNSSSSSSRNNASSDSSSSTRSGGDSSGSGAIGWAWLLLLSMAVLARRFIPGVKQ